MQIQLNHSPAGNVGPHDIILYRLGDVSGPPLFTPGPDYVSGSPAWIAALVPMSAGGGAPVQFASLWARVFTPTDEHWERIREAENERQRAAKFAAVDSEARSVIEVVFPIITEGWVVEAVYPGWVATHAGLNVKLISAAGDTLSCRYGDEPNSIIRAYANDDAPGRLRRALISYWTGYIASKRTQEGTSPRIVGKRARVRELLDAMGVKYE